MSYHKKRHKFADTPSGKCLCKKGVEDTHHFFITCPFYTSHRDVLFSCVETILQKHDITVTNLVQILLYGHPSLNDSNNKNILIATLENDSLDDLASSPSLAQRDLFFYHFSFCVVFVTSLVV